MSAVPRPAGEPSSFGDYSLQRVASSDLVSTTYRASVTRDGRTDDVALRVVSAAVGSNSRATKGFLHVNQRIAEVDHPHLLRVVDRGTASGTAYTATAWRDGLTLADLLRETGPLNPGEALRLGGQLAEALDTVHDRGIVHGTVGVESIWIRRRPGSRVPPSAALTSFGTSHLLVPVIADIEDDDAADELRSVAPEQLRGQPGQPASDQYALACVLYTAVTGAAPFRGQSNNDLFGAHLFGDIPSACALREDLDQHWDEVFARALDKDPAQRFGSCRQLVVAAGRRGSASRRTSAPPSAAATGAETAPVATEPTPAVPDEVDTVDAPPDRRWPLRIVLIALVLLAVLIAVARLGPGAAG